MSTTVDELHVAVGFPQGERFGRLVIWRMPQRILLHVEHLLNAAVVTFELVVTNGPQFGRAVRIVFLKPVRIFAYVNVRVDKRAAAETARNKRARSFERPNVKHAVKTRARVPKVFAEIVRRARKRVWR